MKNIVIKTYIGSLYSLAVVRGCEYLAKLTEEQDNVLYFILILVTIAWPFLVTYCSTGILVRYFSHDKNKDAG
jgi:hypothetical protein